MNPHHHPNNHLMAAGRAPPPPPPRPNTIINQLGADVAAVTKVSDINNSTMKNNPNNDTLSLPRISKLLVVYHSSSINLKS